MSAAYNEESLIVQKICYHIKITELITILCAVCVCVIFKMRLLYILWVRLRKYGSYRNW